MDGKIVIIGLVVILCVSSVGARRTQLYKQNSEHNSSSSLPLVNENGICKHVVKSHGYPCQEHKVTTKDGYILSLQRIPKGRSGNSTNKIPVLLQHGLFMDAASWMLISPNESLAFVLADNGFDVWLANTRGTNYSRGHTSLDSSSDSSYWDWSWDELVAYDLPATVKHVHDQTGQKLHYVGHSLGTLIALAAFCQDKLVDTIRSAALLSPIAYSAQISSTLARTAAVAFIGEVLYSLGIKEFSLLGEPAKKLLQGLCKSPNNNCSDLLTSFTGPNCCINSSRTNDFLDHEPHSTATKNIIHIGQMVREGTIAMYNYGSQEENKKHYGQPTPPVYDMANIPNDLPLFLSYGGQDYLSDVKDVKTLIKTLKDHDADKLVVQYTKNYAHADFIFGENAKEIVYDSLLGFFKLQ